MRTSASLPRSAPRRSTVLLTGATGFVGTHTYPALVAAGFEVLAATRTPAEATKRDVHAPPMRFCQFELRDPLSVRAALERVDLAVYLAHSMAEGDGYAELEEANAKTFRDAAAATGLERIVYLGGMRPAGAPSRHLQSRLRTGEILRAGKVPVVELQATMIIGGGSESFRIVRDVAARLPWMLFPQWLHSVTEPVAIADIAAAITRALSMPLDGSRVFAAPGPERIDRRDIILRTAHLLGHEPRVLDVPLVTPRLSSYWIRLVTRANPHLASELVEGLRSDILAAGPEIWTEIPDVPRTSFDEAVRQALAEEETNLPHSTRLFERVLNNFARS